MMDLSEVDCVYYCVQYSGKKKPTVVCYRLMNSCVVNSGTNIGGVCAMNYSKKNPPYQKRLQFLLSNPSVKSAGSTAAGIRSNFVIAGSLHDKGAGHLADAINTNTQKELTALAREIALGGYYEEAAAIAALASDFQ